MQHAACLPLVLCVLLGWSVPAIAQDGAVPTDVRRSQVPPPPGEVDEGQEGWDPEKVGYDDSKDLELPRGADRYVTGSVVRGTVVDGDTGEGLEGFSVIEYGAGSEIEETTDRNGVFEIRIRDEGRPAIRVTRDGWVETIQVCSSDSRLSFRGEYRIEVYSTEAAAAAQREDTGSAPDPDKGRVLLSFQPQGVPAGVEAELDVRARSWVFDDEDKARRGKRVLDPPGPGEVMFTSVNPGDTVVTLTTPPELVCVGPSQVPVVAGAWTRAYYRCGPPVLVPVLVPPE